MRRTEAYGDVRVGSRETVASTGVDFDDEIGAVTVTVRPDSRARSPVGVRPVGVRPPVASVRPGRGTAAVASA